MVLCDVSPLITRNCNELQKKCHYVTLRGVSRLGEFGGSEVVRRSVRVLQGSTARELPVVRATQQGSKAARQQGSSNERREGGGSYGRMTEALRCRAACQHEGGGRKGSSLERGVFRQAVLQGEGGIRVMNWGREIKGVFQARKVGSVSGKASKKSRECFESERQGKVGSVFK